MVDVEGKYAMKWRFRFNSKKSATMMVGGKGSGGGWKINEERMENVEVFKYHGVWFDRWMRGNVHLENVVFWLSMLKHAHTTSNSKSY